MRAPDFSPVPPDKPKAFLVLIPCVRCSHSCSTLPAIQLVCHKKSFYRRYKATMKASNYLAKLPQEAAIKNIQAFRDYDLITLDVPAPRQRLCSHCDSTDCVIKDSGVWQTVRHIPSNHRGTAVTFHKRRLYCKECHSTFLKIPTGFSLLCTWHKLSMIPSFWI